MSQVSSLEEQIKARAISLGFSLAAITHPGPLDDYSLFSKWLDRGGHADLTYLASPYHLETRKDPHILWQDVRSILVLGLAYPLHGNWNLQEMKDGLIAGYAYGVDYHRRIPHMLDPFIPWLKSVCGESTKARVFTDSAPILERELAARAGLGWIGRNSCLISPTIGSGFLLAEIFLNTPLNPDPPFTGDRCGSCTRCIEACPTSCIQSDRTIDSNRCISYHTIENRGEIPANIRKAIGNWIFGCDICQMVCPWNNRPGSKKMNMNTYTKEKLVELLQINEEEFSQRYGETSISRAKWAGFLRNIEIALDNLESTVMIDPRFQD